MHLKNRIALAALAVNLGVTASATAQDRTIEEIDKYRAQLQEGNPAELWEMRGEQLWRSKRGSKNVSLEQCDLGKGPGAIDGAYAELPRYFADAGRVMDLEARLMYCMQALQGWDTTPYLNKGAFNANGPGSDMAAIATYVAARSNGLKFKLDRGDPAVAQAFATGQELFYRRGGPFDFSCSTCHAEDGKRIRLQVLPNLTKTADAGMAVGTWPAYRVSQGIVRTLQHRMWDCYWQMRHPDVQYTSDVVTALLTYLGAMADGSQIKSPYIKR